MLVGRSALWPLANFEHLFPTFFFLGCRPHGPYSGSWGCKLLPMAIGLLSHWPIVPLAIGYRLLSLFGIVAIRYCTCSGLRCCDACVSLLVQILSACPASTIFSSSPGQNNLRPKSKVVGQSLLGLGQGFWPKPNGPGAEPMDQDHLCRPRPKYLGQACPAGQMN